MHRDDYDDEGSGEWFEIETLAAAYTLYDMSDDDMHARADLFGYWLRDIDVLWGPIEIYEV